MESWHSYPKIYAIGHAAASSIFLDDVIVQEKIDGSQFSFGKTEDGEILVRSKNRVFDVHGPDQMFKLACETVLELAPKLKAGWTYRGEYLKKPKHNTLSYGRHPNRHIILFDVSTGNQSYLPYDDLVREATRLELETVPLIYRGRVSSSEFLLGLLERDSCLGGEKIEGVVVKNYNRFTRDGHAMMGKYVSERFKERNGASFRERNPKSGDVVSDLCKELKTEARWRKSVERLRDEGRLDGSPKDIGPLLQELARDLKEEEEDYIKDKVFKWAWKRIARENTRGFAEWYKEQLVKESFNE